MPLSPSPRPSAHDDGGNFELLRRYTSDARGNLPHGHRGTTFSTTQSHLLYNVADTCVVMPTAGGAPTSNAQNESATFQFKEIVVSHDLRQLQRTNARGAEIAAIVALASGEVLRWMPLARKPQSYTPCVKEGAADGSGVTLIRWCPGTDGAFITAHANGQLLLYDAQRKAEADGTLGLSSPGGGGPSASPSKEQGGGRRSIRVSATLRGGSSERPSTASQRQAPFSSWQVGTSGAAITALSFSRDGKLLAIGLGDGALSLFDFAAEAPIVRLHAYFGAVLTCAWSPDAAYLIT